ncbi:uncharacterized protein Smp_201380 [Schistosoma mansoni]|uniref:uncharacterized protein n=1 Tax=Schistosoma mansoni TaxID=6183 RepID=UPI00022DC0AE|nr:uncharacterized protein Smp_201380 [Schistosoma mansoni]|eukprot:XP_018649673.1 uncharacterized protein Smp_201380 [Schistosoma mansoni]
MDISRPHYNTTTWVVNEIVTSTFFKLNRVMKYIIRQSLKESIYFLLPSLFIITYTVFMGSTSVLSKKESNIVVWVTYIHINSI